MRNAFALIELMVVLTIASIMVGLGLARYYTYSEQVKLKNDAIKLVEVFELAKKKTTAADLVGSCSNFTGYRITTTTNYYGLYFCCNDSCTNEVVRYQL